MTPALPGAKVVCWTPIGWEWSMAFFPIGCWKIDKHSDYMISKFLIVHVIMTINRFLSKPRSPPQPLHLYKLTDLNLTFAKGIYSGIMRLVQKWICLNFMAPDLTVTKIFRSLNLVLTQMFKRKVHKFRVNSQTWGWVLTWGEFNCDTEASMEGGGIWLCYECDIAYLWDSSLSWGQLSRNREGPSFLDAR